MDADQFQNDSLIDAEELLAASLDLSEVGLWSWDLKRRSLYFNSTCYTALGYAPNEFPATYKNFIGRVHEDDKHIVKKAAKKHMAGQISSYSVEFRFLRKDGNYAWLHSRGKIVKYDKNGNPLRMVGVQSDITSTKELQGIAFRSAQLASIGQLAASVAHEINNPITGVINYAQLLLTRSELDLSQEDLVRRIIKEGLRIENIVKHMLVSSSDPKNNKDLFDVKEIIVSALSVLDIAYRKEGVNISFDWPPALPKIYCNFQQIEQVLINILRNAYQALLNNPIENRNITISGETVDVLEELYLKVVVANNGPTIPSKILDKIMEPFFTTKSQAEGTGLGLCISSNIMKEHGGELLVHSDPDSLTELVLYFPAKIEP